MKTKKQKNEQVYKQSETDKLFAFAKTEEGIIILCGKYKVSVEVFKTYEEAETYLESKPYEILVNVACLMFKLQQENEKNEKPSNAD